MLVVKMMKTSPGSTDGIHVIAYQQGETYELPDFLAKVFVNEGLAEYVSRRGQPAPEPAKKMVAAAPENKEEKSPAVKQEELQEAVKDKPREEAAPEAAFVKKGAGRRL